MRKTLSSILPRRFSNAGNPGTLPEVNNNNKASESSKNLDEKMKLESSYPFETYRSEQDSLVFRVIPSVDFALRGVVNKLQVLFQIRTGMNEKIQEKRSPVCLCVVLDRSGSMQGGKISQCKKAINLIIDNLIPGDCFSLVVYDTTVESIFTDGLAQHSKEELKQIVNQIQTRDMTNMGDAIIKAEKILLQNQQQDRDQRIYLFSDGRVNSGKYVSHEQILNLVKQTNRKGISITAFGIGEDFDEDLMKKIAEYGQSNYFYIQTDEDIPRFVSAALGAMLNRIGSGATFSARGKNGGVVSKIFNCEDLREGLYIGDIKQSNIKSILIEMDYTPSSTLSSEEILTYRLSFTHQKTKKVVEITGELTIPITDDSSKIHKNEETEVALALQKAAELDEQILNHLESGRVSEAIKTQGLEIEELEKWESVDKTGRISSAVKKAKNSFQSIQKEGNSAKNKKEAKYQRSLKRCDSADFLEL